MQTRKHQVIEEGEWHWEKDRQKLCYVLNMHQLQINSCVMTSYHQSKLSFLLAYKVFGASMCDKPICKGGFINHPLFDWLYLVPGGLLQSTENIDVLIYKQHMGVPLHLQHFCKTSPKM